MNETELLERAKDVLAYNDVGNWTRPAPGLYPHQWLWDSCFTAIGQRHFDVKKAQQELRSLFRGQWSNGMIPHMIFAPEEKGYHLRPHTWDSKLSPYAPSEVETSGITQPPVLAEAAVRVGEKLKPADRYDWYKEVYPRILAHHQWLYRERDPHREGLAILIHPWETGLDNTPPWMKEMHENETPIWIKTVKFLRIDQLIERLRRDTRQVPADERITTIESLMFVHVVRRLRRKHYDWDRILRRAYFSVEDLSFNCILIRANQHLRTIAEAIEEDLPKELQSIMNRADKALEELWDENDKQYYSRNFITRQIIREPTIATLLPLYAGVISKDRAKQLVELLHDSNQYKTTYPIPTVPVSSEYFNHRRYWQGPTWINTNWLIADGLLRYGFEKEAQSIRESSLKLVSKGGFHEYFSPHDGYGAGIEPFTWSAALTIDFLENKNFSRLHNSTKSKKV